MFVFSEEATLGALIQTKGTQRLARLFNNRFDDSGTGMSFARAVGSSGGALPAAFANKNNDLFAISEMFIAQNAVLATWTADLNDFLYPSATLKAANAVNNNNVLTFSLPAGFAAQGLGAQCVIAQNAAVCSLEPGKRIAKGITVSQAPAINVAANTLTVTLSANVTVAQNDMISFAKGRHEQLVRRWRWYLQNDLKQENSAAIRTAISNALADPSFTKILFHTVEDTQKVIVTPRSKLTANTDELDAEQHMEILLLTQSTTAPDRLDPQ